jgi:hypothetical protein
VISVLAAYSFFGSSSLDSWIIDAIIAFGSTFLGVVVAFELEAVRDRRRQEKEDRADSIAILKALQSDIEKNLELAQETSNQSVQTVLLKPVDYKNVDPSFWKKMQIERSYKLGLSEEVGAAATFYYILEAFYHEAEDFLAWQNSALTTGARLGDQESKMMYFLKAGMIYKSKYLHDTFGSLPNRIGEKIRSLEKRSSFVGHEGNIGRPLKSQRDEMKDLGWLSIGIALTYAANVLPTDRTTLLIGFFTVVGILFLVRKDYRFGLTLIVFGVGLIAPSTGVRPSALCSIVFIAIGLVVLFWPQPTIQVSKQERS